MTEREILKKKHCELVSLKEQMQSELEDLMTRITMNDEQLSGIDYTMKILEGFVNQSESIKN